MSLAIVSLAAVDGQQNKSECSGHALLMMGQKVELAAAETTRKLEGWPSATGLPLEPSSHLEEHLGLLVGAGIGNHDVHVIVYAV
jgi:hypothetical protein